MSMDSRAAAPWEAELSPEEEAEPLLPLEEVEVELQAARDRASASARQRLSARYI